MNEVRCPLKLQWIIFMIRLKKRWLIITIRRQGNSSLRGSLEILSTSWTRSSIRWTKPLRLENSIQNLSFINFKSKETSTPSEEPGNEDTERNEAEPTAEEPCLASEDIETGRELSGSEDTEPVTQWLSFRISTCDHYKYYKDRPRGDELGEENIEMKPRVIYRIQFN